MFKKLAFGVLTTLALTSTAYADTCPSAASFYKENGEFKVAGPNGLLTVDVDPTSVSGDDIKKLIFSGARLKDKDNSNARVVCQYLSTLSKADTSASLVLATGKPTQPDGGNWKGDDCDPKAGDLNKCAFK
ncbi:hypothetical protein [Pseudomonas sp. BGI-2]|uniref:hypothetical protein n=1 Tax=Pseudomonas sp. BGI-2 TaxID=2528211 RepID=UPI001033F7A2|nr:hypothetical protein [Pseudomonas sp. BGI-2]TBN46605.1 hypothetical protein EYC95_12690 [Pseudomonas sp. BGI-2]